MPEVEANYFNCDFIGSIRATVGFNIKFPKELIGGNISLVWKYYEQNPDRYLLSNNSTHNSIQMTFNMSPPSNILKFEEQKALGEWFNIEKECLK